MLNNSKKDTVLEEINREQSQKINELGRLLHDVKLPITVLQSISDILFKLNAQEELENYIFMLDSNIKYLTRIIKSLKEEITELDEKGNEVLHTDIIGYTEMLIDSVRPVCELSNMIIDFKSDCEYYEYAMNYRYYERIIMNVLKNSVKHAKKCTNISVEITFVDNKIRIAISDNGKNPKSRKLRTVEQKPVSSDSGFVEQSSGEGLYIITSLAKKLSANVTYSVETDGMRFALELTTKEEGTTEDLAKLQLGMEQIIVE